jgi:hypothetical protein
MNLHNSYCYSTLAEVRDSVWSDPDIGSGFLISDVTISGSQLLVTAKKSNTIKTYTLTPPTCSEVGFNNSYSGLTVADSLELWGLSLLVMATAFSIKVIKRAL